MPKKHLSQSCHSPAYAGKYQTGARCRQQQKKLLMKFMIPFLIAALPVASVAQAQSAISSGVPGVAIPKVSGVLVIQTARQGVTAEQVMAVIPDEIRATVKLYLDGKIQQWYSRGDGKGVVVMVDAKTEAEARGIIDTLPLAKASLMDAVYVPVGPLMPLSALLRAGAAGQ